MSDGLNDSNTVRTVAVPGLYGGFSLEGTKRKCPWCGDVFLHRSGWAYGEYCRYNCMRAAEKKRGRKMRGKKEKPWKESIKATQDRIDHCTERHEAFLARAREAPLGSPERKTLFTIAGDWKERKEEAQGWLDIKLLETEEKRNASTTEQDRRD